MQDKESGYMHVGYFGLQLYGSVVSEYVYGHMNRLPQIKVECFYGDDRAFKGVYNVVALGSWLSTYI